MMLAPLSLQLGSVSPFINTALPVLNNNAMPVELQGASCPVLPYSQCTHSPLTLKPQNNEWQTNHPPSFWHEGHDLCVCQSAMAYVQTKPRPVLLTEIGISEPHQAELYELSEEQGVEGSLFSFGSGDDQESVVRQGSPFETDSSTFGDDYVKAQEEFFNTEFKAHSHIKKSDTDSNIRPLHLYTDLIMLFDRAKNSPGKIITHTILGHVNGDRSFVSVRVFYNAKKESFHFSFKGASNYPETDLNDLKELASSLAVEATGELAGLKAAFTVLTGLGDILHKARKLFVKHQKPASSVSLREVPRLNRYVQVFSVVDGLETAVIQGLWLILGAGLDDQQKDRALAKDLRELIASHRLCRLTPEKIKRLIDESAFRFESLQEQGMTVERQLQKLTSGDSFFRYMSVPDWFHYISYIYPRLSASERETYFNEFIDLMDSSSDSQKVELIKSIKHWPLTKAQWDELYLRVGAIEKEAHLNEALQELAKKEDITKEMLLELVALIQPDEKYPVGIKFAMCLGVHSEFELRDNVLDLVRDFLAESKDSPYVLPLENKYALALQAIAANPKSHKEYLEVILKMLPQFKTDYHQFIVLMGVIKNPHVTEDIFNQILARVKAWPAIIAKERIKKVLSGFTRFHCLSWATINSILEDINLLDVDDRALALKTLLQQARFSSDQLRKILNTEVAHQEVVLFSLLLNPHLNEDDLSFINDHPKVTQLRATNTKYAFLSLLNFRQKQISATVLAEEIEDIASGPTLIALMLKNPDLLSGADQEAIRAYYFNRLKSFQQAKQKVGAMSIVEAASIDLFDPGAAARLEKHVQEFAKRLHHADPKINLNPDMSPEPHFNHHLLSGHNLLSQLVRALSINKFALISGPPASGKSEVGRVLANKLGVEERVVNCHNGITEEELMQKIGIHANGETQFVITDGPLAQALKHGHWFILNEINLAKAGSLAFLFSILADVNRQFVYYDANKGETRFVDIHPNFRFIATQNPEGPGRKDLNAAFKNRAIEIFAPELHSLEKQALLSINYSHLFQKYGPEIYQELVGFYETFKQGLLGRLIGSHIEGHSWTLRHLFRMAKQLDSVNEPLTAQSILQAFWQSVGVSLKAQDRDEFFRYVMRLKFNGVHILQDDVDAFKESLKTLTFTDVCKEHGLNEQEALAFFKANGLIDVPTTARFLNAMIHGLKNKHHLWLKGPAGTGKTKLAHLVAKFLGIEIFEDTLTPQTDEAKLKGQFRPVMIETDKGKKIGFSHVPSHFVNALRAAKDNPDKRFVMILDEAAFAKPEVLEEINSAIDRDGCLWVVSEDGLTQQKLTFGNPKTKNLTLILASNTYGYSGVSLQSPALRSRAHEIYMDNEFEADELAKIIKTNHIDGANALKLAKLLYDLREKYLNIKNDDARISLREVGKIKEYIEAYAGKDGADLNYIIIRACWVVLGASMIETDRESELGQFLLERLKTDFVPLLDRLQLRQKLIETGFYRLTDSDTSPYIDAYDSKAMDKLESKLNILAGKLRNQNSNIRNNPTVIRQTYFDPRLVSGHNVLAQTLQALTINRFALLSGPPASGKSEVGRYIGDLLGWHTRVANAHANMTEEDLMQKIGVKTNGETSFVITNGPLLEAMIKGDLFVLNEINLAKPGSLAFLFSVLADVNDYVWYYDVHEHKMKKAKISKNFKFIGTMNPDGPGRKELNAALKNRAIEIDVPELHKLEKIALLKIAYKDLNRFGESVYEDLVNFYEKVKELIDDDEIGTHFEGNVWNLRHLMRLADNFSQFNLHKLTSHGLYSVVHESVAVSFPTKDRKKIYKILDGSGLKIAGVSFNYDEYDSNTSLAQVYDAFDLDVAAAIEIQKQEGIIDIPTTARNLLSILFSLKTGHKIWLKGPAGTGKTKLAHFAGRLLGCEKVFVDTFTPQTDESQLKGRVRQRMIEVDGKEKIGFQYIPSPMIEAMREASQKQNKDKTYLLILDEVAFAKPDVLEEINSAIDRDGGLYVLNEDGTEYEFLPFGSHETNNLKLILSSNTYGHQGVNLQSPALRSRVHEIYMDFEYSKEELATLLKAGGISEANSLKIAQSVLEARDVYMAHGHSGSRVSLREIKRITDYVNTFGFLFGEDVAIARAIELVLLGGLDREHRDYKLGAKLNRIIASYKMSVADDTTVEDLAYGMTAQVAKVNKFGVVEEVSVEEAIINSDPLLGKLGESGFRKFERNLWKDLPKDIRKQLLHERIEQGGNVPEVIRLLIDLELDEEERDWVFDKIRECSEMEQDHLYCAYADKFPVDDSKLEAVFKVINGYPEGYHIVFPLFKMTTDNQIDFLLGTTLDNIPKNDDYKNHVYKFFRNILKNEYLKTSHLELIAKKMVEIDVVSLLVQPLNDLLFINIIFNLLSHPNANEEVYNILSKKYKSAECDVPEFWDDYQSGFFNRVIGRRKTSVTGLYALYIIGHKEKTKKHLDMVLKLLENAVDRASSGLCVSIIDRILSNELLNKKDLVKIYKIIKKILDPSSMKEMHPLMNKLMNHPNADQGLLMTYLWDYFYVEAFWSDADIGHFQHLRDIAVPKYTKPTHISFILRQLEAAIIKDKIHEPYKVLEKVALCDCLTPAHINQMIQLIAVNAPTSNFIDAARLVVAGLLAKKDNLSPTQRARFLLFAESELQKSNFESVWHIYAGFVQNNNLTKAEFKSLNELKAELLLKCNKTAEVYIAELLSPHFTDSEKAVLMEEFASDMPNEFLVFIFEHKQRHPAIDKIKQRFLKHYQTVYEGIRKMYGYSDTDVANVTELGRREVLEKACELFAGKLKENNSDIVIPNTIEPSDHFDPELRGGYNLLNQLVQSLAINRFVIITGSSAIAKTEAPRYLAEKTNWPETVVGCHRTLSQEDLMQKVGVVSNGKNRFVITQGPLAKALREGHLFVLKDVNLAKPGSLAFLFSILADVNKTFEYYNPKTGKTESVNIHPNFKFVATQNPFGPGHKEMNAAFKNRAIEIFVPEPLAIEKQVLLLKRYPALALKFGVEIYEELVSFYEAMRYNILGRNLGAHAEGYVWTLRHLERLAESLLDVGDEVTPQTILNAFYKAVGVSFMPDDRSVFYHVVRNRSIAGRIISQDDVDGFINEQINQTFDEVLYDEFGFDLDHVKALKRAHGIKELNTSGRYLSAILYGLNKGYHLWLKGPAGTGKTKLAMFAASLLDARVFIDTLTPQTDEAQLKGTIRPKATKDGKIGFQFVPGEMIKAMIEANANPNKKHVIVIDEAAFARPDVLEQLKSAIDRDGGLWVMSDDGLTSEFLGFGHPDTKNLQLIMASNTYGFEGVQLQSESLRSRTHEIYMDFDYTAEELDQLFDFDHMRAMGPGSDMSILTSNGNGDSGAHGNVNVADESTPSCSLSFGGSGFHHFRLPDFYRDSFSMSQGYIQGRLTQSGHEVSPEIIEELERKFKAVKATLTAMAIEMGGVDVELVFVPSLPTMAMTLKEPRTMIIGLDFLMNESEENLIFAALHEGAHAELDFIGSGWWKGSVVKHALVNVIADLRVNERVIDRIKGRRQAYKDWLKERYHEHLFEALKKKPGIGDSLYGHEKLLEALMSKQYGDEYPWEDNLEIKEAVDKVWAAVQRAISLRPKSRQVSRRKAKEMYARFEAILQNDIYPVFNELYEKAVEEVSRQIEAMREADSKNKGKHGDTGDQGQARDQGQGSVDGQVQGRPPLIDPKDLSDEAKKILEERMKEMAGKLAPKNEIGQQQSGIASSDLDPKDAEEFDEDNKNGDKKGNGAKPDPEAKPDDKESVGGVGKNDPEENTGEHGVGEVDPNADDKGVAGGDDKDPAGSVPKGSDEGKGKGKGGTTGKPKAGTSLLGHLKAQKEVRDQFRKDITGKKYSEYLHALGSLPDRVFRVFDQLLKPNEAFEFEGYFTSGPRVDVLRAILAIEGALDNLRVFLRRTEPDEKNYRFNLLIDNSGSMQTDSRENGSMGLAALFTDVFERLDIPYGIDLFNTAFIPIKGFNEKIRDVADRNNFFTNLYKQFKLSGGTDILNAVKGGVQKIKEARKKDPKTFEFMFVLTDGEHIGNKAEVMALCEQAMKEGIIIVGIGIGEAVKEVPECFPAYIQEKDPQNLPELMAEFIKEFILRQKLKSG